MRISSTMASTLGVGSTKYVEHFYKEEIEISSLEAFQRILDSTEPDLSDFSDGMAYVGFDKNRIAKMAAKKLGAFRTVKLCFLGGMRGTNLKKILEKSAKPDTDILTCWREKRILANGSGPDDLTMGRLMATFPELTAHYLKVREIPKKLFDSMCPACLQFPAAAGLAMSGNTRMLHLEFAVRFSFLISNDKKFHPQYYKAAFNGQNPAARLSATVKEDCGDPTDQESKSFDIDTAIVGMIKKYGEERFSLAGYPYESADKGKTASG